VRQEAFTGVGQSHAAFLGEALEELKVPVPQGAEKPGGGEGKGRAVRADAETA
jgi:hypothetical protein